MLYQVLIRYTFVSYRNLVGHLMDEIGAIGRDRKIVKTCLAKPDMVPLSCLYQIRHEYYNDVRSYKKIQKKSCKWCSFVNTPYYVSGILTGVRG